MSTNLTEPSPIVNKEVFQVPALAQGDASPGQVDDPFEMSLRMLSAYNWALERILARTQAALLP